MRRRSSWPARAWRLRRWVGAAGAAVVRPGRRAVAWRQPVLCSFCERGAAVHCITFLCPNCTSRTAQAYCLYRLGRLQEALAALAGVPEEKEVARLQLEAQVLLFSCSSMH